MVAAKKMVEDMIVRQVPLEDLHESPTNRRRNWGHLDELAKSIAELGVLQPGRARPSPTEPGAFEIVCGHRRFRASKEAGKPTMPMIVTEMTDEETIAAQAVENLQRQDLHELEEAESFEQLRKLGWSADMIAAKVSKSRSHVFQRMKLLDLCHEAREAFYAGEVLPSVAVFLARVPALLQPQALNELKGLATEIAENSTATEFDKAGLPTPESLEPVTAREASKLLRDRFTLRLADAPFDRADADLVPGAGSCKDCPKRSGNQGELFADVPSVDVCTDPTCFGAKKKAAAAAAAAKLEKKGVEVVEGRQKDFGGVAPPSGMVKLDEFCPEAGKTYGEVLKGKRVEKALGDRARTVMLDEKNKPVDLVDKGALLDAAGLKGAGARGVSDPQKWEAARAREEMKRAAYGRADAAAIGKLLAKLEFPLADKVVRALIQGVVHHPEVMAERRGWPIEKNHGWADIKGPVGKLAGKDLLACLVEGVLTDEDELLREVCSSYRIDVESMRDAELAKAKVDGKAPKAEPGACRVCGCSDDAACETNGGPCTWVEGDLCSACVGKEKKAAAGRSSGHISAGFVRMGRKAEPKKPTKAKAAKGASRRPRASKKKKGKRE